ncbi:protein kinase [Pseudomonas sp. dw_612]|uniref:protein kinase domain-containing protein n=1 Tax=Pseudomonas sp. dw_612 TaxID=2720080 RepID=UPI001BD63ACE|nr:protein kinase [Pseudomonas sp. dw_612]
MSIIKYFKANPVLQTDIGAFEFECDLGQGGNANVLKFNRGEKPYAIKFIPHGDDSKLRRFRDEFFCAAQIPTHKNIVITYHFDKTTIEGSDYSLIVMKFYDSTLHKIGHIANDSPEEQTAKGGRLLQQLMAGLHHLHTHNIIHRDIKPQNIFYDAEAESFVIGDLGIAHFKTDEFAKEALTKPSERLANYLFSAPEQVDSKENITAAADIYSLAQVIQWFFTGKTIRGLGRPQFSINAQGKLLSILDSFAEKALKHNPSARFQSIDEIQQFIKDKTKPPKKDPWIKLHDFDDVIRRSFPKIRKTVVTTDHAEILAFLTQFQKDCEKNDFWYVMADGGDNNFSGLEHLDAQKWLMNDETEISVSKLLVHRDNGYLYKNFFILLLEPEAPFAWSDFEGNLIERPSTDGWESDFSILMDGKLYIDPDEIGNGYYRVNNETYKVEYDRFKGRYRYLLPNAVMVVPVQTASAVMTDKSPTSDFINASIQAQDLPLEDLKQYLDATRSYHSTEITQYN